MACDWPISYASCTNCAVLEELSEAERTGFEAMAVDYLDRWTYGQFGVCEVSLRPCRQRCLPDRRTTFWGGGPQTSGSASGGWVLRWTPVLVGGRWFNLGCGTCGTDACSCEAVSVLALPGPVASISQVLLGGAVMHPSRYRLDDARLLLRTDGGSWPVCQDMAAEPDEPNTWQVIFYRGQPVPEQGRLAAGMLACELAKAACMDPTCQLPRRVTSVSRQGVTVAMLDTFDDIEAGHTGIWLVDSFVASVTRPAPPGGRVHSPDVGRKFRSTL